MTRTKVLVPLGAAAIVVAAAVSSTGLPGIDLSSDAGLAAVQAADNNNRDKTKNPCPYPPNRPSMVETADRFNAAAPTDINFSGQMKANCGVGGRKVGLYGKDGPDSSTSAWTLRSTTNTKDDGTFAFKYRVTKTSTYKTVWAGDSTFPAAQSNSVTIKVGK